MALGPDVRQDDGGGWNERSGMHRPHREPVHAANKWRTTDLRLYEQEARAGPLRQGEGSVERASTASESS